MHYLSTGMTKSGRCRWTKGGIECVPDPVTFLHLPLLMIPDHISSNDYTKRERNDPNWYRWTRLNWNTSWYEICTVFFSLFTGILVCRVIILCSACYCSRKNGSRRCCTSCRSCLARRRWVHLTTVRETGAVSRTVVVVQYHSVHQVLWCMQPLYDCHSTGFVAFKFWGDCSPCLLLSTCFKVKVKVNVDSYSALLRTLL